MKYLNGSEIADFVKERQAKQVRALRQSWRILPKLAIVQTHKDLVADKYVSKKIEYANDILIETENFIEPIETLGSLIDKLNQDETIHGIILQLPIIDPVRTDEFVSKISLSKDVDGLNIDSSYTSATAVAIDWLLSAYNIELFGKDIVIIGNGRLVGKPLANLWRAQGLNPRVMNSKVEDLTKEVGQPDILISATGRQGIVSRKMVKPGAVVVDAGMASEEGKIVGDVADDVMRLDDIIITPKIGGVGPLTIASLMDNVIRAARVVADQKGQVDL